MFSTQNRFRKQGLAQAAGIVALTILAGAAEATPVYSGLLNQNLPIILNGNQSNGSLGLDVNGDSVNDLSFDAFVNHGGNNIYGLTTQTANGTAIHTFTPGKRDLTTRFTDGDAINATAFSTSSGGANSRLANTNNSEGQWLASPSGYLGFKLSGGEYGWMFVSINLDPNGINGFNTSFTIRDWAYESVPGTGILAGDIGPSSSVPEPGSALMLAAGLAMAAKRRRTTR